MIRRDGRERTRYSFFYLIFIAKIFKIIKKGLQKPMIWEPRQHDKHYTSNCRLRFSKLIRDHLPGSKTKTLCNLQLRFSWWSLKRNLSLLYSTYIALACVSIMIVSTVQSVLIVMRAQPRRNEIHIGRSEERCERNEQKWGLGGLPTGRLSMTSRSLENAPFFRKSAICGSLSGKILKFFELFDVKTCCISDSFW